MHYRIAVITPSTAAACSLARPCCPVIMELIIRTDPKNKSLKIHRELGQECCMIMSLKEERIHVTPASTFDNFTIKH